MVAWLKKYWPALILSALILATIDAVISSLITCHPVGANPGSGNHAQVNQECTALSGPLLLSFGAIVDFIDQHGGGVTAIFTVVLAVFTGRLWLSTENLWKVTNESVSLTRDELSLARDEFRSSHRPELRLKHIWFSQDRVNPSDIWTGPPALTVRLDIVNLGRSNAYIDFIGLNTLIIPLGDRLPQRPPYDAPNAVPIKYGLAELKPGITFTPAVTDARILTPHDMAVIRFGQGVLYFVGVIGYWDEPTGGRLRQTAFCRYLHFQNYPAPLSDGGRFKIELDPDYEFQD
jgi:hypothetical protein